LGYVRYNNGVVILLKMDLDNNVIE